MEECLQTSENSTVNGRRTAVIARSQISSYTVTLPLINHNYSVDIKSYVYNTIKSYINCMIHTDSGWPGHCYYIHTVISL